jgi:hypothetical protein
MLTCNTAVIPATTISTTHRPPSHRCHTVEASCMCDHIALYISLISFTHQSVVSCRKTPMKELKWKHCFDFMFGFCKSFYHLTSRPHSPYMPDNGKFIVLNISGNVKQIILLLAKVLFRMWEGTLWMKIF